MIYVNVVLTVKEAADIPQIRTLLAEQCRLSRLEPGCTVRGLSLHKRSAGFHSERALGIAGMLDIHRTATAYTTIYQPQVLPKVDRVPHPSELVVL